MVYKYNIDDFIRISNNNYQFELNNNIINNIKYIVDKINDPKYTRLPQFKKKKYYNNSKNKRYKNNVDLDILRNYKKTIINNNKEGIELYINNIKNILNKLSKDTYEKTINDLFIEINNLLNLDKHEIIDKISEIIFKICSSNLFYSELYAEIYSSLYEKYEFIRLYLNNDNHKFNENFKNINYISSDENYDKYCEINKLNDIIKSYYIFYVNLVLNDIIELDTLLNNIINIQKYIFELIDINNKYVKEIINELSDLLLNMINNIKNIEIYKQNDKIILIKSNINKLTKLKKTNKNITNNVIFKNLDILDKLN